MSLVQDDHMVQTFAAETPDQPLDVRILPRTPGGDQHVFDPHVPHPLPKRGTVDAVPITQEILRCLVPREGINDLLGGPLRGGMLSDVEMDETSGSVAKLLFREFGCL